LDRFLKRELWLDGLLHIYDQFLLITKQCQDFILLVVLTLSLKVKALQN
jgi:hypothetical protein